MMAIDTKKLVALTRRYRTQALIGAGSVVAFATFVAIGVNVRHRITATRAEMVQLSSIRSEVRSFRAAFKASPADDSVLSRAADTIAVSTSRDLRVSLAEQIASDAEHVGLSGVRIRFTQADTGTAPPTPELVRSAVAVADYTMTIDAEGVLGDVLALVNRLPPSVALQRITAARAKNGAEYHLVLAVFEPAGAQQHG